MTCRPVEQDQQNRVGHGCCGRKGGNGFEKKCSWVLCCSLAWKADNDIDACSNAGTEANMMGRVCVQQSIHCPTTGGL